ncbi:hypothetical protein A2333_02895 [Candidatus Wolfebacteria bacterium RIFOXYB2_FULL_49_7]|uniref:Uncharacterized protein n=1 Tax=Candidatus Wolfebacteria bacterium RIFOXYB1_FULL_54_12 TaxID=1802559 RepID=A0A1F8DXZ9_9BACT|nr:MAG: hypothetical protein A2372_03130 [Candidatus Wolfebacteria bacterium RIFOXYB1_FULL_54_12]OGM96710.1 MAG: hypothetical protein A2333_02895 [Candidatus Wolfebacteria bacterium RIFOXYB2_FULL_49_7]
MESKLHLKENPELKDFQNYIAEMLEERGFAGQSIEKIFMLFTEECGELAKAARKSDGMHVDGNSEHFEVAHELADVFNYLLDIANYFNVDLEQAFREKEEMNKKRTWQRPE